MTCMLCKYDFCWLCLEKYRPEHFQLGCRIIQFQNNNVNNELINVNNNIHHRSRTEKLKNLFIIAIILFLPIILAHLLDINFFAFSYTMSLILNYNY